MTLSDLRQGANTPPTSKLGELNARLDTAIAQRVALHRHYGKPPGIGEQRKLTKAEVTEYLAGLRAVRDLEDELEPERAALGATSSRAAELARQDRMEEAA